MTGDKVLNCIPASALGLLRLGGLLVLRHLELLVRVAPRAVGVTALGHVHHLEAGVVASENYQNSTSSLYYSST